MAADRTALARQKRRLDRLKAQGIGRATVEVHDGARDILDALRPLLRDPEKAAALRGVLARAGIAGEPPRLDHVLAVLRAHQEDLRKRGVIHASVFGSVARGDARPDSDVDVMVTFEGGARPGLFGFTGIRNEMSRWIGHPVDLVKKERLMPFATLSAKRDEVHAF